MTNHKAVEQEAEFIEYECRVKIDGGWGFDPLEQWSTPLWKSAKIGLGGQFWTIYS